MATIWTQADVDALKAVVGTGVLRVVYDGPPRREVQYQSTEQMEALLEKMVAYVARQNGAKSYRRASTRKGF